jgi:hypothetical protein
MPDHFHLLITSTTSLELAIQCLKGGFSFRAKRELGWTGEVWIAGYADHRIRDNEDFELHLAYIANNPVKAGLVERTEQYTYSSTNGSFALDAFPRGLKPQDSSSAAGGAAKAAPFQSNDGPRLKPQVISGPDCGTAEAVPFQSNLILSRGYAAEAALFQSNNVEPRCNKQQIVSVKSNHATQK